MKKFTSIVLAASLLAAAPAVAFAQSSPSPTNQSGPGVSPTVQTPTDQGIGSETGNTKGVPSRGTTGAASTTSGSMSGGAMNGGAMSKDSMGMKSGSHTSGKPSDSSVK